MAASPESVMQFWKDLTQIVSYGAAVIAIGVTGWQYLRSKKLERAKWDLQLYEKFFEQQTLKEIREILDDDPLNPAIAKTIAEEPPAFTDYLNFFEFVAFLREQKQIGSDDLETLFGYYLNRLRDNPAVAEYVHTKEKGYEKLSRLLKNRA